MEARRLGRGRVKVLLDTNMLLLLADGVPIKEDIESSLETLPRYLCTMSVVREIETMVRERREHWRKALWVLGNLEQLCELVESISENADEDLVLTAQKLIREGYEVVVATSDKELRRRLRERGIPNAYLRESEMMVEVEP